MSIVDLLALFSDPASLKNLSMSQKMTASLVTTLLGMGITFIALIVLQAVITIMAKVTTTEKKMPAIGSEVVPDTSGNEETSISEEEVAAITLSLSMVLNRPPGGLVIRRISRVEDTVSAWNRAGLNEQIFDNLTFPGGLK